MRNDFVNLGISKLNNQLELIVFFIDNVVYAQMLRECSNVDNGVFDNVRKAFTATFYWMILEDSVARA